MYLKKWNNIITDLEWMKENIQAGKRVLERMSQIDSDFSLVFPNDDQVSPESIHFLFITSIIIVFLMMFKWFWFKIEIDKTIRSSASTNFHFVGSARMGINSSLFNHFKLLILFTGDELTQGGVVSGNLCVYPLFFILFLFFSLFLFFILILFD